MENTPACFIRNGFCRKLTKNHKKYCKNTIDNKEIVGQNIVILKTMTDIQTTRTLKLAC